MPFNKRNFILKQHDTLPSMIVCLIDRGCLGEKRQFSLQGATGATFSMQDDCGNHKILFSPAQITSFTDGTIQYNWKEGDTDEAGVFLGEFEINYADGKKISVPSTSPIRIEILGDINPY